MGEPFLCPEDLDNHLNWPLGTSARMARRRRLPHYTLPDGSVRFRWPEVEAAVTKVPLKPAEMLTDCEEK